MKPSPSGPAVIAAAAVGLLASLDVWWAVLEVNELPVFTSDAALLLLGAIVLIGAPCTLAFLLLVTAVGRVLSMPVSSALSAVSLGGAGLLVVLALVLWAKSGSAPAYEFVRRHAGITVLLFGLSLAARGSASRMRGAMAGIIAAATLLGLISATAVSGVSLFLTPPATVKPGPAPYSGRLVLLGVDGMGWDVLHKWKERENNGDLEWLTSRAAIVPLKTLVPTESPRIWSSIATGLPPEKHGILDFTSWEFVGLRRPRLSIPRFEGAFYWHRAARWLSLCSEKPVSSIDMRRRPFWEIISRKDRRTDVVGWWATWPPQPFDGRLVSDKFYFGEGQTERGKLSELASWAVFPPMMSKRLLEFRVLPEHVKVEEILSFVDIPAAEATALAKREWQRYDPLSELPLGIAMDKTHYRLAEQFLADGTANGVFAFYFRGLDIICHAGLQYSNLYPDTPVSAEDRKRYGNLVSRYYAYTLAQLRRLIEQAGEGTVVIIVSDHGFERLGESAFGHDNAPPGVLAVLGGGSPPGFSNAPPAVVYDVAPTILWLSGYPVAADMPGHPLKELYPRFETQVARVDPPRTYGYRWYEPPLTLATEKGADQEMMNLLRTLGYIK